MSNKVTTVEQSQAVTLMEVISRAAADASVDMSKMTALLDMQERIMAKQAEIDFNVALAEMQPLLPTIARNSEIRHNGKLISKYAKYEHIDEIIRPIYTKFGFSISFENEIFPDGRAVFYGILSHKSGHRRRAGINCPPDTSGSKSGHQAQSAAETYGTCFLRS